MFPSPGTPLLLIPSPVVAASSGVVFDTPFSTTHDSAGFALPRPRRLVDGVRVVGYAFPTIPGNGEMTMLRRQMFLTPFCAALLFAVLPPSPVAPAAADDAKTEEGKVAGILFEKKDDWITVKADGEDAPVKYVVAKDADKKLVEALKTIFNASRVELTYKQDGDSRQLVGIKRQVLKDSGTVTGVVVNVYNDFWVEVKPKDGPADAYAPGANYKDKDFMAKLKGLKPGDSVTIRFNTDFERHRILTLQVNDNKDK